MVREKKNHLQISVLDLPILKTTQKNQISLAGEGGGEAIIEANTWDGAEGENTKAAESKL